MSVTTLTFSFATAMQLAAIHTTRRGGEPIGVHELRLDNAACSLLRASRQQGGKLHRFLTVTHRFYTPATSQAELQLLAADVLRAGAPVAPSYTLEAMRVAG